MRRSARTVIEPAVVCVGETLWDVLPGGEFLGGAPLNVAAHLARLGTPVALVSRVGADPRGRLARARIAALGVPSACVQVDPQLPTGEARAALDSSGAASYTFREPAAWDRIEADETILELARRAPAVVFGTLAQRASASRAAIDRILAVAAFRVLDVNLRPPHAGRDVVLASLARANLVKLNVDELRVVSGWLGVAADPAALQGALAARFGTATLCITYGAEGSLLWHDGEWFRQFAYPTAVVDTIGTGDAFLAMLLAELLAGSPAPAAMRRAARLAAHVASHPGAVPAYDAAQLRHEG